MSIGSVDVTEKLEALIRDIGMRVPQLAHVATASIACLVRAPRSHTRCRVWATTYFRTGSQRAWDAVRTQPYLIDGIWYVYVIVFDARLFFREPPVERLKTVVHELWHIHPSADGRRRPQRHGTRFEAAVSACLNAYLASAPSEQYAWLLAMRDGDAVTARVPLRRKWPRRLRLIVPWSTATVGVPLRVFDGIRTARRALVLDAQRAEPRFTYRCTRDHVARTWGRLKRVNAYCKACHDEHGDFIPFVLATEVVA